MSSMLNTLQRVFEQKDLRKRIVVTLIFLGIYRLVAQIPLSIIDKTQLADFFQNNQLFGLLDIFSGGALSNFSIGFMGVGPYITASIVMQLLGYIVPQLEQLQKEGEQGRMVISQYTRLLTVPFSLIQGFGLISLLKTQGVIPQLTPIDLVVALLISTAATVFLMWLGEIITEQGIGNGLSLIITAGIIAGFPTQGLNTYSIVAGGGIVDSTKLFGVIAFLVIALLTVAFIVFVQDAIRRIPISYARRVIGRRSLGGADTYLPIKINAAGVIPIIFALSIIVFPGLIARYIQTNAKSDWLINGARSFNALFDPQGIAYGIAYFLLVIIFTYFYTSIIFKPKDIAENLQRQNGFIPGIRPGSETMKYLANVVNYLTLPGSLFLGIVAILPFIIQSITKINTLVIGGTSILIIVSVVLETAKQIRANLISSNYDIYK